MTSPSELAGVRRQMLSIMIDSAYGAPRLIAVANIRAIKTTTKNVPRQGRRSWRIRLNIESCSLRGLHDGARCLRFSRFCRDRCLCNLRIFCLALARSPKRMTAAAAANLTSGLESESRGSMSRQENWDLPASRFLPMQLPATPSYGSDLWPADTLSVRRSGSVARAEIKAAFAAAPLFRLS